MLFYLFKLLAISTSLAAATSTHGAALEHNPKKRQIYREQVLPHAGGRIPDTAFETDRLFLNQLQKDGIAVPDGILPEQRNQQVYPFFNRPSRKVFRIALSSDGRYIPQEGRYHYQELPSIDTTYLYPQIHGQKNTLSPDSVTLPVYSPFRIHNPLLNQVKFQPKDKSQFQNVSPFGGNKSLGKAKSYQNVNILNSPLSPITGKGSVVQHGVSGGGPKNYLPDYTLSSQSHLFNDFDELFNQFDVNDPNAKKSHSFPESEEKKFERVSENVIKFLTIPEENGEDLVQVLKYDKLSAEEFETKWISCANYRLNQVLNECSSLREILKKWPEYKSHYKLIDIDFSIMHKSHNKMLNWDQKILKLFNFLKKSKQLKCHGESKMLETLQDEDLEKALIVFKMLSQRFLATICLSLVSAYAVYAIQVQTYGHLFHPPAAEAPHHKEEKQDLNKIPGVPGVDYPVYHEVPHTSFSCAHVPAVPGMYANVETGCQAYHVCHDGREGHQGASFLCTNGTIFNQKEFACDWWYNVKCEEAVNYYHLNADPEHNPYTPKKKIIEEEHLAPVDPHHGHGFLIHA
ncbi:uncharacterized protein LOC133331211 [Musca vetustissima]|uniref:uncharacterized protein LOC133331211 n=1 Tax=Musca vetustissima TaxID=27455 RepID=UPI002AB6AC2D|nr:uncharacterized protein LOC133331211 [Musca vetustissima]